jgi:hypothetical protein
MPIIYEPRGKAREYSDLAANAALLIGAVEFHHEVVIHLVPVDVPPDDLIPNARTPCPEAMVEVELQSVRDLPEERRDDKLLKPIAHELAEFVAR